MRAFYYGAILWFTGRLPTNKGIKDWPETFANDEVLATAVLDRLLHASHVLNVKGRSYRLRDLEDNLRLKEKQAPATQEVEAAAAP